MPARGAIRRARHMAPVLRRQLFDAGNQQASVRVAGVLTIGHGLVVVQSSGLRGGGTDQRDWHVQTPG